MSQLKTPIGKHVVDILVDALTNAPVPNVPFRANFTIFVDADGRKQVWGDAYPHTGERYSQASSQMMLTYAPYPTLPGSKTR